MLTRQSSTDSQLELEYRDFNVVGNVSTLVPRFRIGVKDNQSEVHKVRVPFPNLVMISVLTQLLDT